MGWSNNKEQNDSFEKEWLVLMLTAKEKGLSLEEVRTFFREKSTSMKEKI